MAIRLYTTRDNTGTPVSYDDVCSTLPGGLNDKTLSLQTDQGESWRVWTDFGYKGTESPILSGTYDFNALLQYGLVQADGKGRISSLQKLPSNPASVGSITLYQGKNLDGASRTYTVAMSALDSGWNDAARSCEVFEQELAAADGAMLGNIVVWAHREGLLPEQHQSSGSPA